MTAEPPPDEPGMTVGSVSDVYESPSARRVLGRAFDLDIRSSGDLRRASLFMASQFLIVVGPLVLVLAVLFIRLPDYLDQLDPTLIDPSLVEELALPAIEFFSLLSVIGVIALVGWLAITIESQIIAISILAGRLVGQPMTLREAVARARQTFWRVARASVLVTIPALLAGEILAAILWPSVEPGSETMTAFTLMISVAAAVPFAYVTTGIVLGDVGARESIVRGFRLARARWGLAVVIALFTAAAQFLQIFAIGAGGDIVVRIGGALDLGFDHGAVAAGLTYGLILASILAVGTMLFTTIALAVAPQVVAFVALTHVFVGLERARDGRDAPAAMPVVASTPTPTFWDVPPPAPTRHRIVSIPMLASGVLAILLAVAALDVMSRLG